MNRPKLLKIVNPILGLSFFAQAATGLMLFFGIWESEAVAEIHEWNGFAMIALVVIHLWLNWGWVRANFFKGTPKPQPSKP